MPEITQIKVGDIIYDIRDTTARNQGLPSNGTAGQFLKKNSNTSYDVIWSDITIPEYTTLTTSIGSASIGTEISSDDITSWSTGSLPSLGTEIKADDITAWSTGTLPTLGTAISVDDITSWSTGTLPSATVQNENLTINFGTLPNLLYNEKSIPNITNVGTLPSLTYSEKSIPNIINVGTLPNLQYTEKSIPNITITSVNVVVGLSTES